MRSPFTSLFGAGFFALLLSGTALSQPAGAVTITYTATQATWVPNPNALVNSRPLQYSAAGTALTTARNFIYQNLIGDYAPAGAWIPVSQLGSGSTGPLVVGEQRFDYYFEAATTINSGPPQDNIWDNNSNLSFGSFYLDGTCDFCGSANAVSITTAISTGRATYLGQAPNGAAGNQNNLTSSLYNIVFGASGKTGTLQYEAYSNITNATPGTNRIESSGGRIIITTSDPILPVPAPLPLFGAGAAFGMSRQLRRRIQRQSNDVSAKG